MSHAPEVIYFGRFAFHSARHRVNIAVAAAAEFSQLHEQLQTRALNISVARHHLRVNTVSQTRMYKLCSLPADWRTLPVEVQQLLLAMDHSAELFP